MPQITDVAVHRDSIASKIGHYTDLDLTKSTGEYYITIQELEVSDVGAVPTSNGTLCNEIDNWTELAVEDTYRKLYSTANSTIKELMSFMVSEDISSGSQIDLGNQSSDLTDLKSVYVSNGIDGTKYAARPGDPALLGAYSDPNSIYKASLITPIYLLIGNELHVFPSQTGHYAHWFMSGPWNKSVMMFDNDWGNWRYGPHAWTDNTAIYWTIPKIQAIAHSFYRKLKIESAIDDDAGLGGGIHISESVDAPQKNRMPDSYLNAIALKTSSLLIDYRMRKMKNDLPKNVDYATLNELSVAADTAHGWERVRFYIEEEEDSELTSMLLSGLNAETQSLTLRYQWYQQQKALIDREYEGIFQSTMLEKRSELEQS
tara:strand:+ start:9608 stop:10726 length:1119 start_codon:yes stop_codon:yes gene_type:complete